MTDMAQACFRSMWGSPSSCQYNDVVELRLLVLVQDWMTSEQNSDLYLMSISVHALRNVKFSE